MVQNAPARLFLNNEVTLGPTYFILTGDYGRVPVVVHVDAALAPDVAAIVAMRGQIQKAAQRRYDAGLGTDVFKSYSTDFSHKLTSILAEDLTDAAAA